VIKKPQYGGGQGSNMGCSATGKEILAGVSQNFYNHGTFSQAVGAHAHHLRKIPHTQKCKKVNRRNITPVLKVTLI
jgi:hypothetical protein